MFSHLNLAYITSMATGGLSGFNYRELIEMVKMDTNVTLFVTKYVDGPYMAPEGVQTIRIKMSKIFLSQLIMFFKNPVKYVTLIFEAIKYKALTDCLIAQYWSIIIKKRGINWIHCHWGDHKLYIGYFCKKISGISLSVTLHGYDLYANPNWKMFEHSLKLCDRIITISEFNKKYLIEKFGDWLQKIKIVRLSADINDKAEKLNSVKHVLIVGGFQDRKGYDILIDAFKIMNREDIHLWIVGYKGPVDVPGLVKKEGLSERVTVFGHVSDEVLKFLYFYCDIFTMPSRFDKNGVGEGLPVSLMEAMSYKKPIVATRHTGIPELVPDILVEENDAEKLAEGIIKLADNPVLRKTMGERNYNIVKQKFTNENVKMLLYLFTTEPNEI